MMNYWLFLASLFAFISMAIGFFVDVNGYFIPSFLACIILSISFFLTSRGRFEASWHLVLTLPMLIVTFLPIFNSSVLPSCLILFLVAQTIVFILFTERKILFSFLIFYNVSAIICCYFLFSNNGQNYNSAPLLNIVNLTFGLLLQFNAMLLLQKKREQSQNSIIENENKFRSIFEENPLGILLSNANTFLDKEINSRYSEMFGYTPEEVKQLKISQFTYKEDINAHKPYFKNLIEGKKKYIEFEKRYVHKNGSIFWAKTSVAVVRDKNGKPSYHIAMIQDITQSKAQEEKIQQLLQELQNLNTDLEEKIQIRTANLQKANEKLQQSNEDLEQFAYIASHDLQEPLRMVGNFVQLLKRRYSNKIDDSGKEYIQFAVEGVTRMSELMKGLLEYSRVGQVGTGFQKVCLNNLITSKLLDINQLIKDKGAEVIISDFPDDIICEPIQLGIVFYNLIVNALKFNDKNNPTIHIGFFEDKDIYTISIKDNGIGINEEYQSKVFEIFKRLNNRDDYQGNGIGLALCKKIILRHGGKIWFESQINQGTTFYFTISKTLAIE